MIADIDVESGNETVDRIEDDCGEATFVEADVTEIEAVEGMVDHAVDTYGSLDFAHNSAGVLPGFVQLTDVTEEDWDLLLDVHVLGVWK